MDFLAPRRVARAVLMNVLANPQEDLKQFRIGAPQFSKEGLREAVRFPKVVGRFQVLSCLRSLTFAKSSRNMATYF